MSRGSGRLELKNFAIITLALSFYNLISSTELYYSIHSEITWFIIVEIFFAFAIFSSRDKLKRIKLKDVLSKHIKITILVLALGAYIFIAMKKYPSLNLLDLIPSIILISILIVQAVILDLIEDKKLSERQLKWMAAMNRSNKEYRKPNILWRFKLWFNPRFDIKDLPKNPRKENILEVWFVLGLIFLIVGSFDWIIFIFAIIFMNFTVLPRYILDKIFGTYVKTTGICIDKGEVISSGTGRRVIGYFYKIVDFENERYMYIRVSKDEGDMYDIRDEVAIIHGAISKRILHHYKVGY